MTIAEFRRQAKARGWQVRKRRGLEVLEVSIRTGHLIVYYAELPSLSSLEQLLEAKRSWQLVGGK